MRFLADHEIDGESDRRLARDIFTHTSEPEERLPVCEYCEKSFEPVNPTATRLCPGCWCYECDQARDGGCVGTCERHNGRHFVDIGAESYCELCERAGDLDGLLGNADAAITKLGAVQNWVNAASPKDRLFDGLDLATIARAAELLGELERRAEAELRTVKPLEVVS